VPYIDKVLNATTHTQVGDLSISGEVDRIYKSIPQSTTSVLQAGTPVFNVSRDNLPDTVIWNPWAEKAKATADFEPKDGYKKMLCVEVGAVNDWQKLDGGESWEGGQIIQRLIGF
jgi:glucose-6-phosphate 1-epimerase